MDSEELKRLAADPRFVPGIYNYCDRWCERCTAATRCLNFAMEQEERDPEAKDPENREFWEAIAKNFRLTMELLVESAAEQGIDLDDLDLEEAEEEGARLDKAARNHPLAVASRKYVDLADKWTETARASLEKKEKELATRAQLQVEDMEPYEEAVDIEDAMDVVRWYQFFIHVKLMRATRGRKEGDRLAEEYGFPKDSDGSVKIALIAIDRSIGAWAVLRNHLPDQGDAILDLLVLLGRLRHDVEQEFPHARAFVRPGFVDPV